MILMEKIFESIMSDIRFISIYKGFDSFASTLYKSSKASRKQGIKIKNYQKLLPRSFWVEANEPNPLQMIVIKCDLDSYNHFQHQRES